MTLRALTPELAEKYSAFLAAVDRAESVSPRVMALCRARIQQIHGQPAEGISPEEADSLQKQSLENFSAEEQAALVVAERFPFQHHLLTDEEVNAVKSSFGDAGCVGLLTALAFYDVTCRLDITMGAA